MEKKGKFPLRGKVLRRKKKKKLRRIGGVVLTYEKRCPGEATKGGFKKKK